MEMIHPGGWFPAGRPLPPSLTEDDRTPAGRVLSLLDGAAAARARMAYAEAAARAEEGAAAALEARDGSLLAEARNEAACAYVLAGELGRAEDALGLTPRDGEAPAARARTLVSYAVLAGLGGRADAALEGLDEAAGLLAPEDEHGRLLVAANRARALTQRLELGAAERAAAEALRGARRAKTEHGTAVGLMAVGLVALARGLLNEARSRLGEAARGFARTGDRLRQVQCHHLLGEIAYDGEDPIRAGTHYRDGLSVAREAGALDAVELLTLRFEHR